MHHVFEYCMEVYESLFTFLWLILLSCSAFPIDDDDKTLQLKIGFDLASGTNGSPTLRIRNFEEIPDSRKLNNENKNPKRSVRAESSSESENNESIKTPGKAKAIIESDLSEDVESSGSEGERRLSTKGFNPEDFEPEDRPKVHEKYKDEDSE